MIVCVDFDGTIVEHRFPEIGPLLTGATEALGRLRAAGWFIVIHSCRNNPTLFDSEAERQASLAAMERFLVEQGVPFDAIDGGDCGKPAAHLYIDDKAFRFEDNWGEIGRRFGGTARVTGGGAED